MVPLGVSRDGRPAFTVLGGGAGAAARLLTAALNVTDRGLTLGEPAPFPAGEAVTDASISPDGRWLAYESPDSRGPAIFVRPLNGGDARWTISTGVGQHPVWARDRNDLIYRSGETLMSVGYTVQKGEFVPGRPQVWLALPKGASGSNWDILSDGKRVVALVDEQTTPPPTDQHTFVYLENFFDELRRRVPVP
jgi:hypothetical protein